MKKITIIDGYSLLFRAYFATAYPGMEIMRGPDGTPTNAIFAFSNMINRIITNTKEGEALFVALDTKGVTFRKEQCETYKANRKPVPEDLKTQFPIVRDFLQALGIYHYEQEGYEGDDIAGTVATLAEKEGYQVIIYTSDKDYLQLVSNNVTVNLIRKGLSDVVPMTPEVVKETLGFEPKQIIDYKGLRGDSSDNLPGIPGIGDKTAVKLIQEYGSFDEIIKNADNIPGKIGESIRENKDKGTLCRDLAIIQTNIEIPFDTPDCVYTGYDFDKVHEFCDKYGLKQFLNKMPSKWKTSVQDNIEIEVKEIASFEGINLTDGFGIAIDYQDSYTKDDIYGISIYANDHYYITIENAKKDKTLLDAFKAENIKKYCFDYKAIKVGLSRYGIEINGLYFDLLIASYLLDTSMKNTPEQVFNIFGVNLGSDDTLNLLNPSNNIRSGKIAYYSFKLERKITEELKKVDALELYTSLEIPLATTLAEIEIEGFPLDINTLDAFGDEFKAKADKLQKEIYEMVGEEFNLSSPKQIADILFNKLGLNPNKKMSTSVDNLKELVNDHPVIEKILEYRKYFKLISTYIEGLKPHICQDGKIHAHFNQALTSTGRLSSSEPNLQNISVKDEEGKLIRKAFFYPNNDYEILSLDYSQIELRILAYLANCEKLKDVFKNHIDIHTATAKTVFNIEGNPTAAERRKAKAVNFGIIYGISDFGLAEQIGSTNKEAKQIITSFYTNYPEIALFFSKVVEEAKANGYVSTLTNRRRYLRELYDSNYQTREFAKRAAMNAPIQGTAADLIKISMNKVRDMLLKKGYKTKMICQIHDELLFKVPSSEKDVVLPLIKDIMEDALNLSVPLVVDGGFGLNWYEAK